MSEAQGQVTITTEEISIVRTETGVRKTLETAIGGEMLAEAAAMIEGVKTEKEDPMIVEIQKIVEGLFLGVPLANQDRFRDRGLAARKRSQQSG